MAACEAIRALEHQVGLGSWLPVAELLSKAVAPGAWITPQSRVQVHADDLKTLGQAWIKTWIDQTSPWKLRRAQSSLMLDLEKGDQVTKHQSILGK